MTCVHVKRVAVKKVRWCWFIVGSFIFRSFLHTRILTTQTANEMAGRTKCDALHAYVFSHIQFKIGAMALAFFVLCVSRHTNPMCAKTFWLHLLSDGTYCTPQQIYIIHISLLYGTNVTWLNASFWVKVFLGVLTALNSDFDGFELRLLCTDLQTNKKIQVLQSLKSVGFGFGFFFSSISLRTKKNV